MTRSTRFRLLAAILVSVGLLAPLLGTAGTPASAVADVKTDRLGGANRFETAAAIARSGHPSAQTAIIASGVNFPDALAASYLAGAVDAPILLVLPNAVPEPTSAALQSMGVRDVIILGGPAAVSAGVEAQLRQRYGVSRVAGDDRYKTAVEAARRGAVGGVGTVDGLRTAFLTTGLNFPDALGAGPLAYDGRLPIFLTRPDSLPAEVSQAIRDLNIEHVVILGGTQAVSAAVEAQVESTGASTERLNGRNRAETATLVADFALTRLGFEGVNVILARGDDYPDALAGGPLGGVRRAVIVLTATSTQLAIETRNWLEDHFGTVARITALGGTAAVSDAVLREAELAAETNNLPANRAELTISGGSMNGGPEWQYQQSNASPSKSLTLSGLVTSDPGGNDPDAERVPTAREDVVFNIRPTQGDNAANQELNLTARTDSNGVARVSYTRGQPGTDIITLRLADDPGISDDGVGRWNTDPMPLSLDPNTVQTLQVNQPREFTVCVPGPDGVFPGGGDEVNLTTLELVDDNPDNDTNVGALAFSAEVVDDRADGDQTIGKVTTDSTPTTGTDGCATFTVTSNSAQIFTLMAFQDSVVTPAANDDNTNPPEYRDIAGATVFTSTGSGINIAASSPPTVRNGRQVVYTLTAVDAQGRPFSSAIDVSFAEITDNQPLTTTSAEFDWFDNSTTPSTTAGNTDDVPSTARPVASGTTRIEVVPNSAGKFTFAITHPPERLNTTSATPIGWIDLPGGANNRPDEGEPQGRGPTANFTTGTQNLEFATLESLGCPPGTPERGTADTPDDPATPTVDEFRLGNPADRRDPCLGRDVLPDDPRTTESEIHVPWPLRAAPTSVVSDASTAVPGTVVAVEDPTDEVGDIELARVTSPGVPDPTTISRGDITIRWTFRDETGRAKTPPPNVLGVNLGAARVCFVVIEGSSTTGANVDQAPNRPNAGSDHGISTPGPTSPVCELFAQEKGFPGGYPVVEVQTSDPWAEIVLDSNAFESAQVIAAAISDERTNFCPFGESLPVVGAGSCEISTTVGWSAVTTDTTEPNVTIPANATADQCPLPTQPCFNGNLVVIDKARESYVMNRGGTAGGTAYVVYAAGAGGEMYSVANNQLPQGERKVGPDADEYFINGLPADREPNDADRCAPSPYDDVATANFLGDAGDGCARFEQDMTFDDRMVYEFSGNGPTRVQTHFLTNGQGPIPNPT